MKKIFFLFVSFFSCSHAWFFNFALKKSFVLMLEAGGDCTQMGRGINDNFESAITLEWAGALKRKLEQNRPTTKIVINRTIGQKVEPLQNAQVANILDVNLYISLHAYHQNNAAPTMFIYQFSYQDPYICKSCDLSFCSIDTAYLANKSQTTAWANVIKQTLCAAGIPVHGVYQLPFKPLLGIKVPSIGIEIGLQKSTQWQENIDGLAQAIIKIIDGSTDSP